MFHSSHVKIAAVMTASAMLAAAAWAVPNEAPGAKQPAHAQRGAAAQTDSQLAAWLLVDNEGEVALGKLAQERTENEQVKQFAEQMEQEHSQFMSKLQEFSHSERQGPGHAGRRTGGDAQIDEDVEQEQEAAPAAEDSEQEAAEGQSDERSRNARQRRENESEVQAAKRDEARERSRSPAVEPANGELTDMGLNLVSLKQELGRQCLESTRNELEQKEGQEFDKCYMTQQVIAHMHALDTMRVFKNHASDKLQQVLDDGIRTAEAHLKHAKELAKKLEKTPTGTARREKTGARKD